MLCIKSAVVGALAASSVWLLTLGDILLPKAIDIPDNLFNNTQTTLDVPFEHVVYNDKVRLGSKEAQFVYVAMCSLAMRGNDIQEEYSVVRGFFEIESNKVWKTLSSDISYNEAMLQIYKSAVNEMNSAQISKFNFLCYTSFVPYKEHFN